METIDIIKRLCKDKGISISQLESDLEYGNGSLVKAKSMSADRLYKIAQYFGVSMEYLITGKTIVEAEDEVSILRQQQAILMEINKINQTLTEYYKQIDKCKDTLTSLKKDYNALENKKNPKINNSEQESSQSRQGSIFDLYPELENIKIDFDEDLK